MEPEAARIRRFRAGPMLEMGIEPFPEIHRQAHALSPGEGLLVIAPFIPSPLVEQLGAEGFRSKLEPGRPGEWHVLFWRDSP